MATKIASHCGAASTYYYNGDHLGSSNVISNRSGGFHEYMDYFPYGETWVEERVPGGEGMPYKFTSAEKDPETGLYYHGARYYEDRLSRWTSIDKYLERYLPLGGDEFGDSDYYAATARDRSNSLRGRGGVYHPINLNLYCYGENNPLLFIDPDGNENILFVRAKEKKDDRFESEALVYPNNTFSGVKFFFFKMYAAIKEFFGGHVNREDAESFLGKPDAIFGDFSTLPDSTKDFGTVASGKVYDYRRRDFNGMKAYVLSDPSIGDMKVPQDKNFGKPIGKNPGDGGAHPAYVQGSHIHAAGIKQGKWGGSEGCLIQRGFQAPGGLHPYLQKSKTGQEGKVLIYR